jgi:hypothetical protein
VFRRGFAKNGFSILGEYHLTCVESDYCLGEYRINNKSSDYTLVIFGTEQPLS